MLNSWKDELERILESSQESDPIGTIMALRELGLSMGHETGEALLARHPEFFAYRPVLTEAFRKMVHAQDIAEIKLLLQQDADGPVSFQTVAPKDTSIGLMSSNYAYNRLNEVFDSLDFRDGQQVVMVGCGGRPFTMFRFHDQTTASQITGLDIVPEAVETANTLAAKLGYARIRAELCNGLDYDYADAQVVYIANMVSPKAAVVTRVAETAPEDVTIIVWDPCSLGRLWADRAEDALDPRLQVIGRTSVSQTMTRDIILKRRRSHAAGGDLD